MGKKKKKPKEIKKAVNGELVEFAAKARNQHMTYGQLQIQETWAKIRADREKAKKGGGSDGCKKISSAG